MKTNHSFQSVTRQFLSLLLAAALTCSMAGCGPAPTSAPVSEPEADPAKEEQERFDAFTEEVFLSELDSNILNLHFTLAFPQTYGIEDYEVSLGDFSAETEKESYDSLREYQEELESFDYQLLTEEQQLTYDIFLTETEDTLAGEDFRLYGSYMTPTTGMQSLLPTLLAEYAFYQEQDIEDYLEILRILPDYFESLIAFEKEQSEAGFFMADFSVDKVIDQCRLFMEDPENHYLIDSFNLRSEECGFLDEESKAAYQEENRELILNSVIPAYEYLVEELTALKGTGVNEGGLPGFENGKEYYEYLVRENTGSDKSVEEIYDWIVERYQEDLNEVMTILSEDPEVFDRMEECPADLSDPYEVLNSLKEGITDYFPEPANLPFRVSYVPASMEEYSNPAYYILPPIDYLENNVIYINSSDLTDSVEDFVTLAHEGFPGHLYQTTYFYSGNPAPIRKIFSFSGYSEGWGTYAEMFAYHLLGMDENVIRMNELNKTYTFAIYCLSDIGINYIGWSYEDAIDFLKSFGIEDEVCQDIYEMMVEEPALYLSYYLGYLEFLELREEAKTALGSAFDLKEFHTFLLDLGPAQFEIIEDRMQDWIGENTP